jgi:hypothetical protein
VVVADDELDTVQTALLQVLEELAPMGLGFTQGDANEQR